MNESISVLKTISLIAKEYGFGLASLVNLCWVLSCFLFLCLLFPFSPNVISDPFIPLSQLVIVALFFLGSVCDYAVLFWKHILIFCNPIFFLHNNFTITVFTVCAVIGISLISVLLANLYDVIFSLGSLFLRLAGFPVSCLVMVIYSGNSSPTGSVFLRFIFLRISHSLVSHLP